MKVFTRHALVSAFAFALASPVSVYATNGMWMIGYGAKGTAMGGAGVAYPQDAMAAAYNPASMTEVGEARLDATVEFFRPPRSVTHDPSLLLGDTSERSKDDLFPIPAIGAVLSSPGTPIAMGMAVIGAGLGTNYAQSNGTFFDPTSPANPANPNLDAYNRVGVFLMQMQMLPSMAYKVSENHSVGASLVIAMQTFRAFGLESFASNQIPISGDPEHLTNKGYDWSFGWGWRAGWFGKFLDGKLNLGLNYAPRVSMQKFNRYSGLFAEHGEFDIPESITAGLAIKVTPKMNVAFDVQRIYWNDVKSIGNPGPVDTSDFNPLCPGTDPAICKLGGDLGMGFGWTNQTVYKLGFDYKYRKDLVLRAGLNYGKTPIPNDQVLFNMLAPATTEKHLTFGATYTLANKDELTLGFMHAFEKTIEGPTAFRTSGTAGPGVNAAISMSQTSFSIAYGLKF
ncbi:long-chain fatty acid transporter [Sulfuricaulis limicola]|uniref:Long-chain fatty acid transporter n=1 Tax=Sulfuricaulis limicola TaxID=1620215 RepID=A0A1B4XGG4_9GAMM|nr:outer membrane protein transport protein [Sulfuricaulis limicola]BAV33891.1 long-chain fatty acid transporter [Sulfuricaulis limicola]